MSQTALFVLLVLCSGKKLCRSGEDDGRECLGRLIFTFDRWRDIMAEEMNEGGVRPIPLRAPVFLSKTQ